MSVVNLYVGNLPFETTEEDLRQLFGQYGTVANVQVIKHRDTGRSRGFAFVEMSDASSASAAISTLNGRELDGRALRVNEAQERAAGGGGGRGGYGGGGRGGYGR